MVKARKVSNGEEEVQKHGDKIAVSRVMRTEQVKERPLKEPLVVTAGAAELEYIPREKSQQESSGGCSQSRKGDFAEVPW